MNFINFESATEKERIRNEIRNAREEMLKKAKKNAEARAEYEANKKLKGENTWMHPSISDKLKKMMKEHKRSSKHKKKDKEKTKKKNKKSKKGSKKKKRKHSSSNSSSDSESSSSTEEEIIKKKKKKRRKSSSSSSSSSDSETEGEEDEWVEKNMTSTNTTVPKKTDENLIRDNWMTEGQLLLKTYAKDNNAEERKDKNKPDTYDPTKSSRELNPHWRDGGKGIPTFQRPREDDGDFSNTNYYADNRKSFSSSSSGNWRKNNKSNERNTEDGRESDNSRHKNEKYERNRNDSRRKNRKDSYSDDNISENDRKKDSSEDFLTDQQMNDLGAKLIKAEIMGNEELIKELKGKLEKAREIRKNIKEKAKNCQPSTSSSSSKNKNNRSEKEEHILLTTTNSKGMTKPLSRSTTKHPLSHDPYGGRKANKRKEKVETHIDGERVRYFPDDDRYDIKQMFEREKYVTGHDSDAQFIEIAGKHKNPKDDLEDIFADKVRKSISDYDRDEKEKKRATIEHERYNKVLESCEKCFDSPKMEKGLMVAMGTTSYLSIPYHVGLQAYHCCITPMQHITCSTQLDEDTWNEITEFRKALTRMFSSISKDVIFFEIANYLHKKPHMIIHCVASENFEMAPMYFKKAIQESEYEWSTNKQLITLKDKDLRRSIPKGLPYFWVNFGMDLGFAHVIEDQHKFKSNFAQEIIGGILQLNHKSWRKPRKEQNFVEKVKQLAELWKPFDFTS